MASGVHSLTIIRLDFLLQQAEVNLKSCHVLYRADGQRKSTMLRRTMSGVLGKHLQSGASSNSEVIQESRVRLVSGLKRYFHSKRAEGLLGSKGMQILDYACDVQTDNEEEPLFMWKLIEA